MKPLQPLNISNFLSNYAFNPGSSSLSSTDKKIALGLTIGLGIVSLGLFHLGLAIAHSVKKLFSAKKINSSHASVQNQASKVSHLSSVVQSNPTKVSKLQTSLPKEPEKKQEPRVSVQKNEPVPMEKSVDLEKAQAIIQEAQGCMHDLNVEMKFSTIQRFKRVKAEAKKLLNESSTPADIKAQMGKIVKQYQEIVDGHEVLSILKKLSEGIRDPDKINPKLRLHFYYLINQDQLSNLYLTDKDKWKEEWAAVRQNFWNGSIEADGFLQQRKKITFITGTKASSLPFILKINTLAPTISQKPALVPTGQLLRHNIVPLAGELLFGIRKGGVNLTALSGTELTGLDVCLGYASKKNYQFNEDIELDKLKILDHEDNDYLSIFLPRIKVAALRLLTMGAKKEEYESIKKLIRKAMNKFPQCIPPIENWKKNASLVGAFCKHPGQPASDNLQVGQVVAVPRTGYKQLKYGIITGKNEDGSYCIQVERNPITKNLKIEHITVISEEDLERSIESLNQPLSDDEIYQLENEFKGDHERLKDILELFESFKPINLTAIEMDLIQNPFPIVWASVSLNNFKQVRSDIQGERGLEGKAVLGDDIQLVFTHKDNVSKLEGIVKDLGVQVLSFEAAYFISGKNKGWS